jgi:threonine/homoserine efflux transporter RhtA
VSKQPSKRSNGLVRTETKITACFVGVALVSVFGTTAVTDRHWVHLAVLLGVGVIAPTLINEWRNER